MNPELEEVGIQLKLGVPTSTRYAVFLNIVQKAFDPPVMRKSVETMSNLP